MNSISHYTRPWNKPLGEIKVSYTKVQFPVRVNMPPSSSLCDDIAMFSIETSPDISHRAAYKVGVYFSNEKLFPHQPCEQKLILHKCQENATQEMHTACGRRQCIECHQGINCVAFLNISVI
jgi:hypothetical protein